MHLVCKSLKMNGGILNHLQLGRWGDSKARQFKMKDCIAGGLKKQVMTKVD